MASSSNIVVCIELSQISECMFDCYNDDDGGEWTVAYLLSRMKCGEATLPERLQIQSAAVDPYLFVEISTHIIETLTLRLTSSVAFTLIMTSPCFTTPNNCCFSSTIRKGDVTKKPDAPNMLTSMSEEVKRSIS